ncbi:hypothetical protein L207DRAFT_518764 [Hyaloscypha variabilis F]|uniref:Apple domain-containing protein n=1 Tax=Hyaloscypha variabilis (strain UAMH 11265 / GT02V1 / F) TaxID=1149755 RepID=A0A2J6R1L3_HYAVF|nr:hypothetical protein L207DRAFT_518764 [Hyaloscypha variabilis F]
MEEPMESIPLSPQPKPKPKAKRTSRASLEPLTIKVGITLEQSLESTSTKKRTSRASLEPPVPFSPSRLSSEAPEVVPGQPLPEPFVYMNYEEARKRASSEGSEELQPWEIKEKEKGKLVPTPQVVYDPENEHSSVRDVSYQEKPVPRYRTFRLLTVIIMVIVAFLLGGGIGGGVGGALLVNEKAKSRAQLQPNTTSSAAPSTSTVIVDTAGCPLVNNSTYTTSNTNFLKLCATEIVAPSGQNIDISNSVQSSFDSCLDSCGSTAGCVGASWVIFSALNPSRNSVCYLKNKTVVATAASVTGETVVSGFLESAIGM